MSRKTPVVICVIAALAILAVTIPRQTSKTGQPPEQTPTPTAPAASAAGHQAHITGTDQTAATAAPVSEDLPTVEISAEKQQLIGVRIAVAAVRPLERVIRTVGRIEYDERRISTANTKIEGWIEKLNVDYLGRYVNKGEPLAEIYSPELYATQQEYLQLLKWGNQHQKNKDNIGSVLLAADSAALVEAARQRLRLWDISDEQIKKIEQSASPIRTLAIHSPVSGYVVQKTAVKGMRVMPGDKLFDIADLSNVWIIADIYEYEMPLVRVGQTARVGLSYIPGKEFQTKVEFIYPALSAETRTSKVRLSIPNPGGQLKPQMFTNVEIKIPLTRMLAVPQEAVIDTGIRRIVYVDRGEGLFEPREVVTGAKAEGFTEIVKGLKAGEKVAASANFLIDSEARLKGVVK